MKFNRIGRILVCLVLICALVVNISPIKAEATGVGSVLGVIKGASLVSVPVAFWAAAALIAIGVTVDWATDPNYNSYDALVNDVSTFLTNAGTYVKDGMVEMYRVVDETGKAVYYAAGDAMEAVRGWLFDSGTVSEGAFLDPAYADIAGSHLATAQTYPYYFIGYKDDGVFCICWSLYPFMVGTDQYGTYLWPGGGKTCERWDSDYNKVFTASTTYMQSYTIYETGVNDGMGVLEGLALGQVPTVPIDGTGAREWSEEYTNNGLYIVGTGGGGDQEPNNGKWFWPLAFGLTAAELYAMSQADQWAAETPAEFDQYETKEEFAVSPGTELEFGQSIELSPSTDSETGGDTGSDTGTDSEIKTDYTTWFQKVVDWLEGIWEAITNIPDAIVNGIKTILQELFVPDPDFIPNKVAALQAQYSFLEPMQQTGEDLKLFFQNIGSQPPIIWIDLGAGTGWYPMGGKVKFIDLTWYSQYKPTADFIVGGSIWLWLAWRMFKAIPGIISGDSGSVGAPVVAPDLSFNTARLPVGRTRRKKDGE